MHTSWSRWCAAAVVGALALAAPGMAAGQAPKTVLEEIQEEVPSVPPSPAAAAAETTRDTSLTAGVEKLKPYLASSDGNFRVELGGRVQFDYHAAVNDARSLTGTDLADRFLVRRARLELSGQAFRWVDFKIEAELTEGVSLKDAYLDLRFLPQLRLRGGQFKVPFSREELTSSRFIDFVERSILNELSPAQDAGVMLHGELFGGVLAYNLGAFNGTGEDTADNNDGKDLAARLVLSPFATTSVVWLKNLYLAGNATWGDQDGINSPQGRTSARTSTRFTYFAAHPARGDRSRFGGDLAWLVGPAALKLEYAEQRNERQDIGPGGADLDDVLARGWYVSGTWIVTGEEKPLNGPVVPRRPFSPLSGGAGPGAWEVGVRYARLDFESSDPLDFFDGNVTNGITGGGSTAENGVAALTVGVNWYLNARVRAMVNWTHYWYDNRLGTPTSCATPSCSAGTLRRGDNTSDEVLSRLQIWF